MRETLGVDIGGVIIRRRGGALDTALSRREFLDTPAVPGAFEGWSTRVRAAAHVGARVRHANTGNVHDKPGGSA